MASATPQIAKTPCERERGRIGGSAGGMRSPPGTQTPPAPELPSAPFRGRDGTRGCCGIPGGKRGTKPARSAGTGACTEPQGRTGAGIPSKVLLRGRKSHSFTGKKPSDSFLCCGQATFSAAINHCPRSSPLARACRRPGTLPAGFGTSFDSGEICKTIFINNIRGFIFNSPVCKAKRGLSRGVVVRERQLDSPKSCRGRCCRTQPLLK